MISIERELGDEISKAVGQIVAASHTAAIKAGANYLVVDTPAASGVTRPGAYKLTVESHPWMLSFDPRRTLSPTQVLLDGRLGHGYT